MYYLGGSNWAVLRQEDLGFTIADNGYNRGEAYTATGIHPVLPPSGFDKGYLFIAGVWQIWDTRYLTEEARDYPYAFDISHKYDKFTIHSPVVYIPIVVRN